MIDKKEFLRILNEIDNYCWIAEIAEDIEKLKEYINK